MDARYYNGEPGDWPSVEDSTICPDCGEDVTECDATCGCADCRRRDCEAADLAESLIPVTRGVE